ncbi:flagellar biosynthesis protein FlhA [Betaproteobacteria bacterium SCN2]|jgi:flagellar biosynthesis protein FlhA|nr:flagellar biosynthesis protein FlhA [Betaproteobacteria bacterium SCN2]
MSTQLAMARGRSLVHLAGALLVLLILAMMVLPLPAFMLDMLFTLNIALAVIVLLVALNAGRPLDFSVFPTVLLVTTLMRLALNVASTRIILVEGHTGTDSAGKVIESFGNFLVAGNYTVGLVVFVILVIINFVVITRGAGRIAEVAARFTLDAMPGKQLAIDADLASGAIGEQEARRQRADVAREADFYGAMDGASKFVRGDAVAALIILVINLVGGIAVGMFQHGMGLAEALDRYALLTVGDGLVAQIPALVISTAAGIVVSRTSNEQDLNREFMLQLFGRPQILYVAASVLAVLGIIPGMPHTAFLLLAAILAATAWFVEQRLRNREAFTAEPEEEEIEPLTELTWSDLPPVDVLGLEVGYRMIPLLDRKQGGQALKLITEGRLRFALEMGLVVPPVRVRDNMELRPTSYRISLKGVEAASGEAYPELLLAIEAADMLGRLKGDPGIDPLTGAPGIWIEPEERERALMRGYRVIDASHVIARHVEAVYRAHAGELLGRTEVQQLLDSVNTATPGLVEEVTPRLLPLTSVQAILQNLVTEGVSIRDTRSILETLAARASRAQDIDELTETVRASLGRNIVDRLFEGAETLYVIGLSPKLESQLIAEMGEEGEAMLSPELVEALPLVAERAMARQLERGGALVLLVAPALRAPLARMLRRTGLPVLSYAEIPADKSLQITSLMDMEDEQEHEAAQISGA